MLKLGRITKVKVLFLVLVFVFNFDLFKFSEAILENGLLINAYFNSDDLGYRYSSRELLHRPFFGSTGRHCTIISSYDTYTTYVDTEQKFRQVIIK